MFEGRGAGVRSAANGTSSIGGNDHWYAVCYLSGQGDLLTDAGKAGLIDAVQYLRNAGAGEKVNGHRDHHPTECPGDAIYQWLKTAQFGKPELTRGPLADDALAAARKAKRAAKGEKRRATIKAAVDALRSLPTWPKRG